MKNSKNIIINSLIILFFLTLDLPSEEFDITAKTIKLLQNNQKVIAEGNVLITGEGGLKIEAEKASYDKKENIIDAEKSVKITNTKTNDLITSDKIKYLKNNEQILIEGNIFIKGKNGITIETESASYDKRKQLVTSARKCLSIMSCYFYRCCFYRNRSILLFYYIIVIGEQLLEF